MSKEKIIKQLEDLKKDRESFLTNDEEHDEIYLKDIEAIETVLKALERLQEDYIPKDKIREILNKLEISDIEPWSTYKVDGEILFDLEELLEGK